MEETAGAGLRGHGGPKQFRSLGEQKVGWGREEPRSRTGLVTLPHVTQEAVGSHRRVLNSDIFKNSV